jgi:hypothetical protein
MDKNKYNRFVEGEPNLDYAMRKLIRNRKDEKEGG